MTRAPKNLTIRIPSRASYMAKPIFGI